MAPSTDTPPAGNLDLLRILCCVAWSDGDFSAEERELLQDLVERYVVTDGGVTLSAEAVEALAERTLQPDALDELISRLDSDEDRQLALKLGYMMIRVGRRPGDESSINPLEKVAYRRLVEGLGLGEADIAEAEWAAELDLQAQTGLQGFLSRHFSFLLP
ncbi:TerB family tellurite resistance protein [Synechococcus sp. J7-Johnson]|uniref:tellurite resistance TerB family protein n=1 Tax=Synechococcus sp. J7-Johnson TaxID=2823737 RepID=UPI0020CD47D5|nr:TerB family tellurite resistance protein [Synechococcus sp. J7-Johnson]MCP9841041.1 TerB family tellurite resistance protein [Synechococcus sp. J7-Johnson]